MLLRLGAGVALICPAISRLLEGLGEPLNFAGTLVAAVAGIFLLAGLWTPLVGTLVAIDETWICFSLHSPQKNSVWTHILLAVLTAAVAMVGPGAWSIDARLFGRRRVDIGDRKEA